MLFSKKEKKSKVEVLSNFNKDSELFQKFITLQNEINVTHDTKVIAVTSIENDLLTAAFANALALTYAFNDSKTMIIDANMYNPSLNEVLCDSNSSDVCVLENNDNKSELSHETTKVNENLEALCFDKQVYPGNVFKSKVIQDILKKEGSKYEHFIILVPSIKEHKEVSLLKDVLKSIVLVVRKDVTKKKDIYEAISFFREAELPLAKTVIIE